MYWENQPELPSDKGSNRSSGATYLCYTYDQTPRAEFEYDDLGNISKRTQPGFFVICLW